MSDHTDPAPLLARVRSGAWLDAQTFPPVSARALLESGECDPSCLLAIGGVETCTCRCNGYYHGALTDATVEGSSWDGVSLIDVGGVG